MANRIPSGNVAKMLAWVGGPVKRRVAHWSELLDQVNALESTVQQDSDQQLRKRSLSVRYRIKSGERITQVMPEAF
ncbi:MAG: preprotein translocase subunit SecA, partial [Planctomycetota bacterium]